MNFEIITYMGIKDCIKLSNNIVDLIITTQFGPRILFYGYCGKQNFFHIFPEQISAQSKTEWNSYGGHRLWHAPEVMPRTYALDNSPITYTWENSILTLFGNIELETGLQKEITISLDEKGTEVSLTHSLVNRSVWDIEVAAWCLSVMAEGGTVYIPQEDYKAHPDYLVPARPVVLWHFTDMSDPRFTWGKKMIKMKQDNKYNSKQKIGVFNSKGWAAYSLNDQIFIKQYDAFADQTYPDMGCNSEFFTMPEFLEIETLSPLVKLQPDKRITHNEKWQLQQKENSKHEQFLEEFFL